MKMHMLSLINKTNRVLCITSALFIFFLSASPVSATIVLDGAGDGGFETGASFTANNWYESSGTIPTNRWVCNTGATTGFSGIRCGYVTDNSSGTPPTHTYTNTSTSIAHIYRNITFPAGETEITLNFSWIGYGESGYDRMRIWLVPTSYTPAFGTQITATGVAPTGRVQIGITSYNSQSTWTTAATVTIPAAYAGTTVRLVFEWINDYSLGTNPPAGVDNIQIVSVVSNNRYAVATGNWNSTSTWSTASGGAPGASVPTTTNNVYIQRGYTVTVDANSACANLVIGGATSSTSTLSFNSGVHLTANGSTTLGGIAGQNGVLNMTSGGTLQCNSLATGNTTSTFTPGSGTIQLNATNSLPATDIFSTFNTLVINSGTTTANYDYTINSALVVNGGGVLNLNTDVWIDVAGNVTNAGNVTLNAGSVYDTYLFIAGNLTNTGTITATANYTGLYFDGTSSQSFNNNGGTVTASLTSLSLDNTSGLSITGNQVTATRVNLFTGTLTPTSLTIGNGGTLSATVQRGSNNLTTPAGSFASVPAFNVGSGGLFILYDEGSSAYTTGYEIPSSGTVHTVVLYDDADVTLSSAMTISNELEFYNSTTKLRIGNNTLTLDGVITYTAYGEFYGGTTSNLIMGGTTDLDEVINGINDFTVKSGAATTMISDQTFHDDVLLEGTLTIAGFDFNVGGDWTNNGGTLNHTVDNSVATISFNGSSNQYINGTATSQDFYNLKIRNSGGTVTTGGATTAISCKNFSVILGTFTSPATLTVDGTLIQVGGVNNAGTTTNIDGHWYKFGGTFNNDSGTVNFTNTTTNQFLVGSSTFYNASTQAAGAFNLDAGVLYKTSYEGGNAYDWLIIDVTGTAGDIYLVSNGNYPTCTPPNGTSMIEFNSYSATAGSQTRSFLSVPISTYGRTGINVIFNWYEDSGYPSNNDRVTVQYSTDGDTWIDVSTYSRYNATTGWKTKTCTLPVGAENQAELYIAFLLTSAYGNNCHLDNVYITGLPATPSVITVDNDLNVTNGAYNIGVNNTLALNGTITGNTPVVGGIYCNMNVGGSGSNLVLPSVTNGLNNFTITRPNGSTIRYDRNLTVAGTLTNSVGNDALIIQSTASGTGSLIHTTATVPGTIQRYITGSTNTHLRRYHCVSIPLDESNTSLSGLFYHSYLFYFDEPSNYWKAMGSPTDTELDEKKGYLIYFVFNNDTTYNFPGPMKAGNFDLTDSLKSHVSGPSDNLHGWNLVPNPYPSSIDWNAALGWTKTNIDNAIYIWKPGVDSASGTYASYVGGSSSNGGSRYIQVGQSFFIHANTTSPAFSMNNSVRVHQPTAFFKNANDTIADELKLLCSNELGITDELVVKFNADATADFDPGWDAYNLPGGGNVPDISSIIPGNIQLSINTMPYAEEDRVIPLRVNCAQSRPLTFTASGMENFTMTPPIYLEDKELNKIIDLSQNPVYEFIYQPGQEDRFNLIFNNITSNDIPANLDWVIYKSNDKIRISIPELKNLQAIIQLFDASGRKLLLKSTIFNETEEIDAPATTGLYIIKVFSGENTYTRKLVIE